MKIISTFSLMMTEVKCKHEVAIARVGAKSYLLHV